jgi:hypothetical protein
MPTKADVIIEEIVNAISGGMVPGFAGLAPTLGDEAKERLKLLLRELADEIKQELRREVRSGRPL